MTYLAGILQKFGPKVSLDDDDEDSDEVGAVVGIIAHCSCLATNVVDLARHEAMLYYVFQPECCIHINIIYHVKCSVV